MALTFAHYENDIRAPVGRIENYWGSGGVFVFTIHILYCTYTVVHHSADSVWSFLFRLSRAKVGAIDDDRGAYFPLYMRKFRELCISLTFFWIGYLVMVGWLR